MVNIILAAIETLLACRISPTLAEVEMTELATFTQ